MPVVVTCGCCNKFPQTWWLQTRKNCSCSHGDQKSEISPKGTAGPCSPKRLCSRLLPAPGGHIPPVSASLVTSPSHSRSPTVPLRRSQVVTFRAHQIIQDNLPAQDPYLNHICKALFLPYNITFTGSRNYNLHIFRGMTIQPATKLIHYS